MRQCRIVGKRNPSMETQMRTFTKAILGAAMLAGSALAVATPANAQSTFGFYIGNGNPHYVSPTAFRDRDYNRGGVWRWDPYLHRRIWIPAREFYRDRWLDRHERDFDRD